MFLKRFFALVLALAFCLNGCQTQTKSTPTPVPLIATSTPVPVIATSTPTYLPMPYELISQESIFAFLTDLTAIQPYSGWRNSGSSGEAEALDYVAGKLGGFSNLESRGLTMERESFRVFSSVELWETQLYLTIAGQEIEVPADGLRGSRYEPQLALSLDFGR